MKNNKISIAMDMDNVIADFEGEFCERFGDSNRELFDLYKRYPDVDPGLIDEFIQSPDTYKELFPIFGGILLANQIRQYGINLVILTSRPETVTEITKDYLENYNVKYGELIHNDNKAGTITLYNIIANRPIKVLIDDRIEHLENLPDGVIGIAWEQPWNEGYYPRARYNPDNMGIEICDTVSSRRRPFWS